MSETPELANQPETLPPAPAPAGTGRYILRVVAWTAASIAVLFIVVVAALAIY